MFPYSKARTRAGSTYLIVLGTGLIVSVLGLSGLLVVRIQRSQLSAVSSLSVARINARAGLDMALLRIETLSDWRQKLQEKTWEGDQALAEGVYSFKGIDPIDGDLVDSITEPVVVTTTGKMGDAVHRLEVQLTAREDPLEALQMAVHAGSGIEVKSTDVTVTGAPLSCNGTLTINGTIKGSANCRQSTGSGTVTGTLTTGVAPKPLPLPTVFAKYQALATTLPYSGDLAKDVLAPGANTYAGNLNPNGVYFIDCGSSTLKIQESRIHGTLVVKGNLVIDNLASIASYNIDYPALIVSGTLEVKQKSLTPLSETSTGMNFNPPGAPYDGFVDTDKSDNYPNQIDGLVHAQGSILFREQSTLRGVLLGDGQIVFEHSPRITYDPTFWYRPPLGYVSPVRMVLDPASVRQVVQ